ncbi:PorP/SprF family type IX secretion system membrane protein [Aureibacter tunicatorum]|uniref:Type IX secretion system PorP/SprF family membrane protein n=1 Tax=Aureibacter tunicatorum TaxID=866807 RepID=A0AAE3XMA3_9BACT|nr:type IX secretion system membrane protein PorP/SprF [Aureibacter tunicatorum]MDR6239105.1 type IX secretion system PorP/SprF family membrane protein [Aureibacter tunicatorum]BDD04969.1 hypothetical protein AUTU_24520 [Aureibacter tunicatorum]
MILRKVFLFFFVVIFVVFGSVNDARAQDPQFSQFFSAPLYLNPGFTGATQLTRFGANYRNQWPSLEANFTTYSAFADHYFEDYNSGVGIIFLGDRVSNYGIGLNSIHLTYAYQLAISDKVTFRPGIKVGYVGQSANYSKLVFGTGIDPDTGLPNPDGNPNIDGQAKNYFDLGFGGVLYTGEFWLGVSADHLTQPDQSLSGLDQEILPIKFAATAGYKFVLSKRRRNVIREYSFTPTILYKKQGEFDQMDLGMYLTVEPIVLGMWYRGVPFKAVEGKSNHESLVFLIGYSMNDFKVGYSFDYTLSEIGIQSGGAHEISISYSLFTGDPRRPPKHIRNIPCPQF